MCSWLVVEEALIIMRATKIIRHKWASSTPTKYLATEETIAQMFKLEVDMMNFLRIKNYKLLRTPLLISMPPPCFQASVDLVAASS